MTPSKTRPARAKVIGEAKTIGLYVKNAAFRLYDSCRAYGITGDASDHQSGETMEIVFDPRCAHYSYDCELLRSRRG